MAETNYKTDFPIHPKFSLYDWTEGEIMMSVSPVFRREDLTLYCSVPFRDLRHKDSSKQMGPQTGVLDYVICKDDAVLLSVMIEGRDDWRQPFAEVPDIPCVRIPANHMAGGDCSEALKKLSEILNRKQTTPWYCEFCRPSDEYYKIYQRCQLIERVKGVWLPTEYGSERGIIREYAAGAKVRIRYSYETQRDINAAIARYDTEPRKKFEMPLELRISHIRDGVRCNPENSLYLVKEIMNMPLEEYMRGAFRKERATLKEVLPPRVHTYGEAAVFIRSLLRCGREDQFEKASEVMQALATPAAKYAMARVGMEYAAQLRPEILNYIKKRSDPSMEVPPAPPVASLEKRMEYLTRQEPVNEKLGNLPMKVFFQGISVLTRMEYPVWLGRQMEKFWELSPDRPYGEMLGDACYRLSDRMTEATDEDREAGVYTLYYLLIEPFLLIGQHNEYNRNMKLNH